MELVDTHCHIHSAQYELTGDDLTRAAWLKGGKPDPDNMILTAKEMGVARLICVGTDLEDSRLAVEFVQKRKSCWASIGVHPHEAKRYADDPRALMQLTALATKEKVVAIGEAGLDYYYSHSPKEAQKKVLRFQLELAIEHHLPMIFHIREAFDDFWNVLDEFGAKEQKIMGIIHSFTDKRSVLDEALNRGFFIGLNGIMTFTRATEQLEMAKMVPADRLVLETDAPYLTPTPFRGTICEPKHVRVTAEFLAELRGESLSDIAAASTRNAGQLFGL